MIALEEFHDQLYAAAQRRARRRAARPAVVLPRQLGTIVVTGFSIVVAASVAILVLMTVKPAPRTSPSSPSSVAVRRNPQIRQLLKHFAILRRAQTAADRSWAAGQRSNPKSPVQVIPGLTRLAETIDEKRIFLTIDRLQLARRRGQPARHAYILTVSLVTARSVFDAPFNPNVGDYTIIPVALGPISLSGPTTLVSIIPDGIEKVRWVFRCRPDHLAPCDGRGVEVVYPRIQGNIAAARANGLSPVPAVTWYSRSGKAVVVYNQHEPRNEHPQPFPGIRS